jgi:HAMP domain-containing protein
MNLLVRINLVLGATLGLAALVLGYVCWLSLQTNARREAMREAGVMMDSALAIRTYTTTEILPLLAHQLTTEFLPQSVPFYAATQNFLKLREQHPEYSYKEATLNPTNPRDRATDWEADLIQQFRNDGSSHELVGERETPMGPSLYLARPIKMEGECLSCHSAPASAPATLIARYGSDNGFGWQPNEVVGAHVISVPLQAATAGANALFKTVMLWIVAVLVSVLAIVNATLYLLVVRPIRRLTTIADQLSLGDPSAPEFPPTGGASELMNLTRAFNRMRTSLHKAMKLLEGSP